MNIITIIGTRPQYIKLKPFYDYCKDNGISNYIIDTNQHYSNNVSKNLIEELGLKIDCNLRIESGGEISFIANGLLSIQNKLEEVSNKDSIVIVIGDTNSTLISSIVSKKMGLKLAHIEAGIRCYDRNRPEELNRILVDDLSDIHFISRERDRESVSNPVYVGDLEYYFLNSIEHLYGDISYDGNILLTIHRQENMDVDHLYRIFDLCESIKYPITFPIHHRTDNFVKKNDILIPDNIEVIEPISYIDMISFMRGCRGIISDSGGITKTAPFFGKKCIIPLYQVEWREVISEGYAINYLNKHLFDDYKIERNTDLYYVKNSCEIIVNKILENNE
jgi:UDP-GlcNAc3NAcA epimerase